MVVLNDSGSDESMEKYVATPPPTVTNAPTPNGNLVPNANNATPVPVAIVETLSDHTHSDLFIDKYSSLFSL